MFFAVRDIAFLILTVSTPMNISQTYICHIMLLCISMNVHPQLGCLEVPCNLWERHSRWHQLISSLEPHKVTVFPLGRFSPWSITQQNNCHMASFRTHHTTKSVFLCVVGKLIVLCLPDNNFCSVASHLCGSLTPGRSQQTLRDHSMLHWSGSWECRNAKH